MVERVEEKNGGSGHAAEAICDSAIPKGGRLGGMYEKGGERSVKNS